MNKGEIESMVATLRNSVFFVAIAALSLTGCSRVGQAVIKTSEIPSASESLAPGFVPSENKARLSLAIVPWGEKRGSLKSYGSVYSYLIPLSPYGTMRYERPDEARMFNTQNEFEFNMSENLLKILVDGVKRQCGLFSSVIITPTPLESKADLILSGDLYSTFYEGKTYSYGISFLGPALWCLGLPAGSSHKKLDIMLYLKKADTGEVIWSYNIKKENTVIQGLYHNWGKNVNSFVLLMQEGVREAIADMQIKLKAIPLEGLKVPVPRCPPAPVLKTDAESLSPAVPEVSSDSKASGGIADKAAPE